MRKVLLRHTSDPLDGELYIRKRGLYVKKNAPPQATLHLQVESLS
jgi:hypothetical protein